ncbi:MAG: [FeFe] hydrogenase H-cluster radical SAM maturase HydE [Capsulimonadaceae bacterium]|nr:[FeFe] hydrogenase H-cluster radical SAM maturase HydE [Capsulimonadaceae bacterium]
MERAEIEQWLRETDDKRLKTLWDIADKVRNDHVGSAVYLRGLVEFSNNCARQCAYCGLHAGNRKVNRYRMTEDEIVACAHKAVEFGYGTVVLQSGEDRAYKRDDLSSIIRRIKTETPLAVTLSLGEREDAELLAWREAGADRYLLRFETSNPDLYAIIHPNLAGKPSDRLAMLRRMRDMGYEIGSGIMVGIPGQTYADIARDIETFRELDLDMIGIGPYLSHPDTMLGQRREELTAPGGEQAPSGELMTYKAVALTRIALPEANIPSTTALATVNRAKGRELGLRRGANIMMPNITPVKYRKDYQIYPGKACIMEDAAACHGCMLMRIEALGRTVGSGRGDSPHYKNANLAPA